MSRIQLASFTLSFKRALPAKRGRTFKRHFGGGSAILSFKRVPFYASRHMGFNAVASDASLCYYRHRLDTFYNHKLAVNGDFQQRYSSIRRTFQGSSGREFCFPTHNLATNTASLSGLLSGPNQPRTVRGEAARLGDSLRIEDLSTTGRSMLMAAQPNS